MEPGSFDYEGWLFRRGIGATGYVAHDAMRVDAKTCYPLLCAREALVTDMRRMLGSAEFGGMVAALASGDHGGIQESQWRVRQAANTVHLMAIAGL